MAEIPGVEAVRYLLSTLLHDEKAVHDIVQSVLFQLDIQDDYQAELEYRGQLNDWPSENYKHAVMDITNSILRGARSHGDVNDSTI
jgi:hypothetical protein